MSQDGHPQMISRQISNDKPIENELACLCGGIIYALKSAQFAKCSRGEYRCTKCLQPARRFGKRGLTCGTCR